MRNPDLRLLALALALPASAVAQQEPVTFITDVPGPGDRDCAWAGRPDTLPPLAGLADSAALARAIADFTTEELDRRYAVYAVHYGEGGVLEWVAQLDTNLPEVAWEAAAGALLPHLERRQPDGLWTVRIALSFGAAPGFVVGRSEVCPAERVDDGVRRTERIVTVQPMGESPAVDLSPRELRTTRPYRLRVKVSASGRALTVRLRQSSGSRVVDEGVRDLAKGARYLPELHDGVPVVGWYEMTPMSW